MNKCDSMTKLSVDISVLSAIDSRMVIQVPACINNGKTQRIYTLFNFHGKHTYWIYDIYTNILH